MGIVLILGGTIILLQLVLIYIGGNIRLEWKTDKLEIVLVSIIATVGLALLFYPFFGGL